MFWVRLATRYSRWAHSFSRNLNRSCLALIHERNSSHSRQFPWQGHMLSCSFGPTRSNG